MSFVTAIRDYVETLNNLSDSLGTNLTVGNFLSETSVYFLKTFQNIILYVVSFRWLRDFTLLPIVLPQISASIFKESFVLETPSNVFFNFLEIPDLNQNKFLLGFFNSFFLSLPISIVHILSIRRLFIQGIPAATFSISGYILGQIIFLTLTIFGVRQILIPWLTLEPLNYLLGIILIFRIIYSMTRENLKELPGWNRPEYKNFFLTSFILAWCEQTSIFQYLGNLTLSSNVTLLETFSSSSLLSNFLNHSFYILGILIGVILFTGSWGLLLLQLQKLVLRYTPVFLSSFLRILNKTTFIVCLALSMTSIPFYSADYLVTGPLGFVSQDSIFKNTGFAQTGIKDIERVGLLSSAESGFKYLDIDVAPFDRGEYLTVTDPAVVQPVSFEDLNYQGELGWTSRYDKLSSISDSKSGFFTLSKVFKKQKKSQTEVISDSRETQFQDNNKLLTDINLTDILLENEEDSDPQNTEIDQEVVKRFIKDYNLPDPGENELDFLKPYSEIYNTSFPGDFLRTESFVEKDIEQKIKNKYYSNPVYKMLLALDIDFFLKRQPQKYQLSSSQEFDIYTKRRILESYYDSLRTYSQLPYFESFETFFDGAKSFSSKVYNQQFKGTLRSVRRLFSLTPGLDDSTNSSTILKFDQPLYNDLQKNKFIPYHEELNIPEINNNSLLKNNFLPKPLYAGWDEQTRKFVITNKFLPRTLAGYKVNIEPENRQKFSTNSLSQTNKLTKKIKFTTWPLDMEKVVNDKEKSPIPYVTLFKSVTKDQQGPLMDESIVSEFTTLPANLERFEKAQMEKGKTKQTQDRFDSLAPKRGGFIWPGNKTFNFLNLSK